MQRGRHILGFDLLRTVAALLVMLYHLTYWEWIDDPRLRMPAAYHALLPVSSIGWAGVEIFFVLSGFVIAYSVESETASSFAIRRIKRLSPAALICATLTATAILAERLYPAKFVILSWLRGVTFWPVGPWIDGSYWTLPIEIAFYTLVFLCVFLGLRRWLPALMVTVGLLSTGWCGASLHWNLQQPNPAFLLRYGCLFATGTILYQCTNRGWSGPRIAALVFCGSGCLCELLMHGPEYGAVALWLAAIAFLIASVMFNKLVHPAVGPGTAKIIRRAGLATYPFYLIHAQLGRLLLGGLHHLGCGYALALIVTALSLICVAVFISEYPEPWVRSLFTARRGAAHPAANRTEATPSCAGTRPNV